MDQIMDDEERMMTQPSGSQPQPFDQAPRPGWESGGGGGPGPQAVEQNENRVRSSSGREAGVWQWVVGLRSRGWNAGRGGGSVLTDMLAVPACPCVLS